jgi:hypothetical protein
MSHALAPYLRKALSDALFAEDFGLPYRPPPVVMPEVTAPPLDAADLEEARQEGYDRGYAAGCETAAAASTRAAAQTAAAINAALADADRRAAAQADAAAQEIGQLLLASLAAMLPAFCDRHGPKEVARLATAVLPSLRREPQIVIEINPAATEAIRSAIAVCGCESAAVTLTTTGRLRPDEIRINWRDGAARRDRDTLWADVSAVLGLTTPPHAEPGKDGVAHAG